MKFNADSKSELSKTCQVTFCSKLKKLRLFTSFSPARCELVATGQLVRKMSEHALLSPYYLGL